MQATSALPPPPIVQSFAAYSDFPFVAISQAAIDKLVLASSNIHASIAFRSLFLTLEGFLQLTGKTIGVEALESEIDLTGIFTEFLGALASEKFIKLSVSRLREVSIQVNELVRALSPGNPSRGLLNFEVSTVVLTQFIVRCRDRFDTLPMDETAAWIWRAWPTRNRSGRLTQLPFYKVYQRWGRDFTQRLYDACDQYYSGRKSQRIIAINDLANLLCVYPELTIAKFSSAEFMSKFWRDLFVRYIQDGHSKGMQVAYLLRNWNNEFIFFAQTYLVGSGLFSAPIGPFPGFTSASTRGSRATHIKRGHDGVEVRAKLITAVPIQVTDTEAMELLFRKIEEDFEEAMAWARWAASDIWGRYSRRKKNEVAGQVRILSRSSANTGARWLAERANPNFMQNIAATFAHHGYMTRRDTHVGCLYGMSSSQAAYDLAIPTTGALLPHCVLLVGTHPLITPSFLESLDLYDQHGNRSGFLEDGPKAVLIGQKARNGPEKSRQVVQLTDETRRIVNEIIALTEPLRQYLQTRGDADWRKLLLSAGNAFGYPRAIRRLASDTSIPARRETFSRSLGKTSTMTLAQRQEYAERFSLPALRASAGVLIYLRTRDAQLMADALGHCEYRPDLLCRYLPEPILHFFQERWVRIFQAGVIAAALEGSVHRTACVGFKHSAELDQFLANHALRKLPEPNTEDQFGVQSGASSDELLIAVDTEILQILLELERAVGMASRRPNGTAVYWSGVAKAICEHLDSEACVRPDLKQFWRTREPIHCH